MLKILKLSFLKCRHYTFCKSKVLVFVNVYIIDGRPCQNEIVCFFAHQRQVGTCKGYETLISTVVANIHWLCPKDCITCIVWTCSGLCVLWCCKFNRVYCIVCSVYCVLCNVKCEVCIPLAKCCSKVQLISISSIGGRPAAQLRAAPSRPGPGSSMNVT